MPPSAQRFYRPSPAFWVTAAMDFSLKCVMVKGVKLMAAIFTVRCLDEPAVTEGRKYSAKPAKQAGQTAPQMFLRLSSLELSRSDETAKPSMITLIFLFSFIPTSKSKSSRLSRRAACFCLIWSAETKTNFPFSKGFHGGSAPSCLGTSDRFSSAEGWCVLLWQSLN